MTNHYTRYARPALWGFFICAAIAAMLVVVRLFIPSYIHYRWDAERTAQRIRSGQVIREAFQTRIQRLTKITELASGDISFSTSIHLNDISAAAKAFQSLNAYTLNDDQTIDLIDSLGNSIAWNGPSISSLGKQVLDQKSSESFVFLTQNGLRTYVTVGKRLARERMSLVVSEPLEVNSPISNRFIQKVSFCEELSQTLKTQITFRLPQTYTVHQGEYSVPVIDQANKTVAEFIVAEITLDGKISSERDVCDMFITLCIACGCLFFLCTVVLWIAKKHHPWMTTTALILSLWCVRFVWRELNFPATLIGGWLFNPNLYASPFVLGLSSSIGELILTVITVAASAWFFFSRHAFNIESKGIIARMGLRIGQVGSLAFVGILSMLVLWLFRGFGEAVRSFVFDSTIQYNNPSEILPNGTAALMYFNIMMLGVSLLCVSTVLLSNGRKLLAVHFLQDETKSRILLIGIVIICIPIFALLDSSRFISLLSSIIFIALCIYFVELLIYWKGIGFDSTSQQWRFALWMTMGSFVIGAPLLHQELPQRERKEVETVENEFLRPSDSWLTYVVQDGIRTSVESFTAHVNSYSLSSAKENNLAFVLWTKSLIGKEGYNSALILYNQQGNEVDRFVVGMNKPEQQNILSKVFAGEEEAVHIIDRTESKVLGNLYGAWTTIRDSSGQLCGSIAVLLSEHQKAIFREEETEPLRQFGDRLENDVVREIAVHEFVHDSLVFSTGRKLYPERFLSAAIDSELQNTKNPFLWKDILMNGYKTQTVFTRDAASPERIAAISLEELDFRWEMFSTLKEFFICLAVVAVLGMCLCIRKSMLKDIPTLGFRGKLLLGFACITLVPLVVLSYYNKQLVAERVQKQGEVELYSDLAKLQDRISAYVSDEEDFVKGVDDDFCEALAAEYGVDFSVYRGASIQASSRSELYRASLLDGRLNGEVFASTILNGRTHVLAQEKIGSVEYVVGYTPLSIHGSIVGVLAIPTLNRQRKIEAELSQQNAYVFGVYAMIFGIALAGGGLLALRFARPLQKLTRAVKNVAGGNLDINVTVKSHDELGTLAQSFNDMISKLRTSREELAKHERENAWKEMAKQVAHEIRNPLTPMKLSIQHLRQAFKDNAPERDEILQRVTQTVIDQVEALSRIATEFSHFAKMPERKFERVDIDNVLKETINLFKEVQGITFIDKLSSPTDKVIADSDQLRGVFINIIRNAIQAIEKAGTITISTSKEGRWCLIIISDTGLGIPEEIRSKIFEPNFSTKSEGMGIGLAIARRVIEDHGGIITCQSEQGKGTTFEIRLPV
ncbi:MAG: ATP-binding protein [Ignavibacteriales bacterium]|nr:ATP-binding protein [Ignavibacteriales bacterium]